MRKVAKYARMFIKQENETKILIKIHCALI